MMPGQPGMSKEMCLEGLPAALRTGAVEARYLKVIKPSWCRAPATDWWHKGGTSPWGTAEAADLIAEIR